MATDFDDEGEEERYTDARAGRDAAVLAQRNLQTGALAAGAAYFGKDPKSTVREYDEIYEASEDVGYALDRSTRGFDLFGKNKAVNRIKGVKRVIDRVEDDAKRIERVIEAVEKLRKLF